MDRINDIKAPLPLMCVHRWVDVFETSKSRKYLTGLNWTANPTNFNSTGFQQLVEDFDGMERAAVYGAWCCLLKLVAQFRKGRRGILAGEKGEPFTVARLARQTFQTPEAFQLLIPWALKVGWLVQGDSVKDLQKFTEGTGPAVDAESGDTGSQNAGGPVTWPEGLKEQIPPEILTPIKPNAKALPEKITEAMKHSVFGAVKPAWLNMKGSNASIRWEQWLAVQAASAWPLIPAPTRSDAVFCLAAVLAVKAKPQSEIIKTRVALLVKILSARDVTPVRTYAQDIIDEVNGKKKTHG